jgi:flavin-dependent dehydrogenase
LAFKYPKIKKYIYSMHTTVDQIWEKDIVRVYLDDNFRGFFGWIIPHRNFSEIGFGTINREDAKKGIRFFENITGDVKWKGAVIPVKLRERLQKENSILVGDAAGMTKRTTGGGITFMSKTLPWFADAIEGKCNIDERMGNSMMVKEMAAHGIMQKVNETSNQGVKKLIYYALDFSGMIDFASEKGDMDFPMKMIGIE